MSLSTPLLTPIHSQKENPMKKLLAVLLPAFLYSIPTISNAQSIVPDSAFYLGIGGSFNSVDFNSQSIEATGLSNAYDKTTGAFLSSGSAGGPPVNLGMGSQTGFAPGAQAGYFKHFQDSKWLWGAKFSYNGLGLSSTAQNFLIPQSGSYGASSFTGNATVRTFKTNISHQFALMPFIGHSFDNSFIYAGAGPTVSQINTNIDNLIGFADIKGNVTDISGTPQNFSSSQWVVGGAVTVGATYFLDASWFIDANYNIAMTPSQTANYSSTFNNTNGNTNINYTGSLIGSSTGKTTTQTISISINRAF
jgi:hypothetical protein